MIAVEWLYVDALFGSNTATGGGDASAGRLMPNSAVVVACGAASFVASCKSDSVPVLNVPLVVTGKICRRSFWLFTTKPSRSTPNDPARVYLTIRRRSR